MTGCSRNAVVAPPAHLALLLLTLASTASWGVAQQQSLRPAAARSPRDWAVIASENEVRTIMHDTSLLRYQVRTVDQKGERTREIMECTGGSVARLFEKDGKRLTSEEDTAERTRLQDLMNSPSDFARHTRNDATEKKLAVDLVRLMPDAMIYTPAPGAPPVSSSNQTPQAATQTTSQASTQTTSQAATHSSGAVPLIVLDFAPNPAWTPPTTASEALTGLRGRMWIDQKSGYVVRMEGEIFRPVNFGYGMVARVYPGGSLSLTQVSVGADRWIYSHFEEHIRIRALMFKTLEVNTSIESGNHQPVPGPLTWQQAIQLLLASQP